MKAFQMIYSVKKLKKEVRKKTLAFLIKMTIQKSQNLQQKKNYKFKFDFYIFYDYIFFIVLA